MSERSSAWVMQLNRGSKLSLKSSATLIVDHKEVLLVDPGHFTSLDEIDAALKRTPVQSLQAVTAIFYTHLHFDHYKTFEFGAHVKQICMPEEELRYMQSLMLLRHDIARYTQFLTETHEWIAPVFLRQFIHMANDRRYDFDNAEFQQRLRPVQAGEWLTPHIQAVALAGHCAGQLGLEIETEAGKVMVAGDALLSLEDFLAPNTDHHLIVYHQQQLMLSRQRCAQADCAIPGHGPWFSPKTGTVLDYTIWGTP